jgi:hypothetical protein
MTNNRKSWFKVVVANWFPRTTANERHYSMELDDGEVVSLSPGALFRSGPNILLEQPALMTVD